MVLRLGPSVWTRQTTRAQSVVTHLVLNPPNRSRWVSLCLSTYSHFDRTEVRPMGLLHQPPSLLSRFHRSFPPQPCTDTDSQKLPLLVPTPPSLLSLDPSKLYKMDPFAFKIVYFLALVALPQVLASTDAISEEALTRRNSFRALHGASALTWNKDLAAAAESLVSRCVFEDSGRKVGTFGGMFKEMPPVTEDTHVRTYRESGCWAWSINRHRRDQRVDG